MGGAAEAAVGDERHIVTDALAHDGGRDVQHLAHSGATGRALIADDHHVAFLDGTGLDRGEGLLLAIEDTCGAAVQQALMAGQFDHRTLGRQVAAKDRQATGGLERGLDGHDDLLPRGLLHVIGDLLQGATVHGGCRAIDLAALQQLAHHQTGATGVVQINRHVAATGLDVGHDGRAFGDGVELVDGERHVELTRNSQDVHDGVGGATRGGNRGHRVVDGAAVHDVARHQSVANQLHDHLPGIFSRRSLCRVSGRDAIQVNRGQAQELRHHCHGVGGELTAAGAGARAGGVLNAQQFVVVDRALVVGTDRLKHVLHRHVAVVVAPGGDGAVVEHQTRNTQTAERHDGARNRLVTSHEHHHGIKRVAHAGQLD